MHRSAIFLNVLTFITLATLIALGVYVNTTKIVIGAVSTSGYTAVALHTVYWNVGCTIVGTLIGILATVAYSTQDDGLTRRELVRERGVLALYIRPLTLKRGLDQMWHLQIPLERTMLLLMTIVAALSSATVVALFGIHSVTETITNPNASYSLAALNDSIPSVWALDGWIFTDGGDNLAYETYISQLSGFAYKSAYITGLKMVDLYKLSGDVAYLPEQGVLGDNVYATLSTRGIGLNTSSYIKYSGYTDGFNIPRQYDFKALDGDVYGTTVTVTCQNVTAQYVYETSTTFAQLNIDGTSEIHDLPLKLYSRVSNPGVANFTFLRKSTDDIALASMVDIDAKSGEPTLRVAVAPIEYEVWKNDYVPLVMECRYSGREFGARISLQSPVAPLQIDYITSNHSSLGPLVQQRLSNASHTLLQSGIIQRAFADAGSGYHQPLNNTVMTRALELVFENVSEAFIALMRQRVERANDNPGTNKDGTLLAQGSVHLHVGIQRLGSGQYAWLTVLGFMLLGTMTGIVRTCKSSKSAGPDAHDAVELLRWTIQDDNITALSRFRFTDAVRKVED